jgi:hypothetical protein
MKNIFTWVIIILVGFMVGCEETGYIITIKTNNIKYDDLKQIGRMLQDKGLETVVWEREKDIPEYSNEVYTLFEKKSKS